MKKLLLLFVVLLLGCNKKTMIDLSDKSIEDIKKYADEVKLNLTIEEKYSFDIQKNKVISQSIKENEPIKKNSDLKIVLSKGINKDSYEEYKINELGRVPIMMYHGIEDMKDEETNYTGGNVDRDGYTRTAEAFCRDLEFYYKNGYRMIRLEDYMKGKIEVPFGYSPLILTFDDGNANNIKVSGFDNNDNIIIDPNSAVGILEEFKQKYPDFNVTATFFVNGGLFKQGRANEKIMKFMIDKGYDIGNHTYNHKYLNKIGTNEVTKEVATLYQKLDETIPNKYVKIVALPFGIPSYNHDNFKYVQSGNYQGYKYTTEGILLVGSTANQSPFDKNFNSLQLKRIRAYDNNGTKFDITMNFKNLEKNRYISDGNTKTIVIPNGKKADVKNHDNLELITY